MLRIITIIQRKRSTSTLTLTGASMPAGVDGWAPSLITKSRRNTVLSSSIPNFRHEWHVKTHCYTLKNKQRINKLSTNVYVICKYVVN